MDLRSSCAAPGAGDGLDPRFDRRGGSGNVPNRKALQLCAQVARTLAGVLAEFGDDVLRELMIESVVPAPNASRLLVGVLAPAGVEAEEVLTRLAGARARLRVEAAAAVNRRRVPDLVFRVVDSGH